jgi:photosystem II stability/assembly factor-like uncharacterized protein
MPPVTATPRPSATPRQDAWFVKDLTWIDDHDGWALAGTACGSDTFCPRLAHTTDGGQTWMRLPNPPGTIQSGCLPGDCVSHVRFATSTVGYLFGPAFYVTTDGGLNWRSTSLNLPVESVEPGAGSVLRIVDNSVGCPGPCDRTVEAAAIGSNNWRPLLSIPFARADSRQETAELIRQGSRVIYVPIYGSPSAGGGSQQAILFRSTDAGRTWEHLGDPCGGSGPTLKDAVGFAAAPGAFLAALCNRRDGESPAFVTTSNDQGSSWSQLHVLPGLAQEIAAASASHVIASTGSVFGSGPTSFTVWASTNGGRDWRTAVTDPEQLESSTPPSAFLGFEDSSVGRWVGYPRAIWTTMDAGAHWARLSFP